MLCNALLAIRSRRTELIYLIASEFSLLQRRQQLILDDDSITLAHDLSAAQNGFGGKLRGGKLSSRGYLLDVL